MKKTQLLLSTLIASSFITACGSGSSDNSNDEGDVNYVDITIDASSQTEYAYLNLETGKEVSESDTWHLKAKRYSIGLNPNMVEGAIADTQDEYYDEDGSPDSSFFINSTAETEVSSLYAVTDASELEFISDDQFFPAVANWYKQDGRDVTKPDDSHWVLASAEGDSYAKMEVTSFAFDMVNSNFAAGEYEVNVTVEFKVQAKNEAAFSETVDATWNLTSFADAENNELCFDFDTDSKVDCDGDDWDIGFKPSGISHKLPYLMVNGGSSAPGVGSAKVHGPADSEGIADYDAASDVNALAFTTDKIGGIFDEYTWQEYGQNGGHLIWPNYRVYVIDTDSNTDENELIKLQAISYYNTLSTPGFITLRLMKLSDGE